MHKYARPYRSHTSTGQGAAPVPHPDLSINPQKGGANVSNKKELVQRAIGELMEVAGPERGLQRLVYALAEAADARESGRQLRVAELGDAELIILEQLGLL